jgi:alkanesulfonate monooxygenase
MKFHWFLPTNGGDGRQVVSGGHGVEHGAAGRPASVPYLGQIARSAEQLGFEAALTPTGAWCEDAWLTTAMLAPLSERLKFLVAFRPGLTSPTLAAQMAATFQNLTGGRLLLNVVTGGESHEQRAYGDFLDKDGRYERCGEFLAIVRRLWAGEEVTYAGRHLRVDRARLQQLPDPVPQVYFGGSSPAAGLVAAEHADVYLTWGEPPAAVAKKVQWMRELADQQGRELTYGIRLHTIARDTSEEAWAEADRLLSGISDEDIQRVQDGLKRSESVGQHNMLALNSGSRDGLEIHPNLWAGVGLVRGGAGTAMVGSHEEVADLVEQYAAVGIEEFVLSAYPHLEGAYHFREGVLPLLEQRGLWTNPAPVQGRASVPFGGQRAAS